MSTLNWSDKDEVKEHALLQSSDLLREQAGHLSPLSRVGLVELLAIAYVTGASEAMAAAVEQFKAATA